MICDAQKPVAIAGIMGGENSMITDDVHTVLFEAATFNGPNIRKSAKRIGLRTDASNVFEKGLEPHNAEDAINRACQLMQELGCGNPAKGMADEHAPLKDKHRITFMPEKYNKLLGTDVSNDQMMNIFKRLEIGYDNDKNELVIPYFRQDLIGQADIAEEVARFYGYDKIPTTLPKGQGVRGGVSFKMLVEAKAREIAQFCGFSQGMSYSFESPKVFDKLRLAEDAPDRQAIKISNPLGEEFSVMRTISLSGMLSSLSTNYNRRNKNVRLYEMGNIYIAKSLPITDYADERMQFTLGFYGDGDFYTMKGVIEEFLDALGMNGKRTYDPKSEKTFLHPGRQAKVTYEGKEIGYLGEVHPEVCDAYSIGTRAYIAVIDIPSVLEFATFDRKYKGIAKFPAVSRDLSMVVPKAVSAGQIEDMIRQRGGKIMESCELFDIYEGDQVKEGCKSIAYSITFRADDRTLTDDDITGAMKKILNGLESLGIELRQ